MITLVRDGMAVEDVICAATSDGSGTIFPTVEVIPISQASQVKY